MSRVLTNKFVVSGIWLFSAASVVVAAPPEEEFLKNLPSFYLEGLGAKPSEKNFADAYIDAATKLRKLGKDKAVKLLRAEGGESTIVLCRMLFTAKPTKEFRSPMLGAPLNLGGTKDWPLEPIEIIDGVPFVIVRGYFIAGYPEPSWKYLDYTVENCDWGETEFLPKSSDEKKKALMKLMNSNKWKLPLSDREKEFLSVQLKLPIR